MPNGVEVGVGVGVGEGVGGGEGVAVGGSVGVGEGEGLGVGASVGLGLGLGVGVGGWVGVISGENVGSAATSVAVAGGVVVGPGDSSAGEGVNAPEMINRTRSPRPPIPTKAIQSRCAVEGLFPVGSGRRVTPVRPVPASDGGSCLAMGSGGYPSAGI